MAPERRLDRLTERFVDFQRWTPARKTVLLMAFAFGLQIPASVAMYAGARASGVIDLGWLVWTLIFSNVVVVCLLGAALVEVKRGRDGRWVPYLTIVGYGGVIVSAIQGLGVWSAPTLGWMVLVAVLVGVWYGEREGVAATAYLVVAYGTLTVLTLTGTLDYAPALISRSVDDQGSGGFAAFVTPFLVGVYGFTFGVTMLMVRSQRLQEARLQNAHDLIRRYVPSGVADGLTAREHYGGFAVERVKLTVFFSDLQGSTDLSDQLDPEDLALVVNEYLDEMSVSAEAYGTSINHFEGDGLLILFGAPTPGDARVLALQAVQMAFDMQRRLAALRERWLDLGISAPLEARMGINTGYASVGDFGSGARKVYTAIGLQVNVAARIQHHCEAGRVLVSESTWALVRKDIDTVERGEVQLKGIHQPIAVYEALEPAREIPTDRLQSVLDQNE